MFTLIGTLGTFHCGSRSSLHDSERHWGYVMVRLGYYTFAFSISVDCIFTTYSFILNVSFNLFASLLVNFSFFPNA